MPRASPKAASPTAKHKQRSAVTSPSKTHATSTATAVQSVIIEPSAVHPIGPQQGHHHPRPATPIQSTRKRIVRRPKFHETAGFLERESFKGLAPTDGLPPPTAWFPGITIGESCRVMSTMFRAAQQAALETRPVSWGYGSTDGTLGHNNTSRVVEMKRLAVFRRAVVRSVSAGNRLSLFLTDDNRIFQSGRLFMKQDGCAMWKPIEIKIESAGLSSTRTKFVAVEAGHLAAYALDDQGRVYSWGSQIFGQLGHCEELDQDDVLPVVDDTSVEDESPDADVESNDEEVEEDNDPPPKVVTVEKTPRLIESLAGQSIIKLSAGNHFVVAISSNGAVFSWGRGCFGQLGSGEEVDNSTPARVQALKYYAAVNIAAGTSHVLGVFVPREESSSSSQHEAHESSSLEHEEFLSTERTVVMVWGRGTHGCLGLGGSNNELLPRENAFVRGLGATKVAAGADHSLVLCGAGARTFLYAFGGNDLGQLGIASGADHVDMPSFLEEFANVHVAEIGAGAKHSAALTGDGEVFTWGDARYGKTCRVDRRTTFVPWKADLPSTIPSSNFVTQLSVGSHHSLAQLRIGGAVDRWRKFPCGGIVSAMSHEEPSSEGSLSASYAS